MFDYNNWQEIFFTLKKNKWRSFFTAFGVFWGIFMLVIMLGSGKGLQNGTTADFNGMATNSFFVWAQSTSKPFKGFKRGREFDFNNDDIKAIKKEIPEVDVVSGRNQIGDYGGGSGVIHNAKSGSFSVMGDFPEFLKIQPLEKLNGRFINDLDIKEKRKIAVIGNRVAQELYKKDETVLGSVIKIKGINFQVVGIFQSNKSDDGGEFAKTIYVPFTTFQSCFNLGNRVGWFSITSKENIPCSVVEIKVKDLLKKRHSIAPDDNQAVGSWNAEVQYKKMQGLFMGIQLLIWIVGIGTLLAGVIGISNIMLVVVKERTKEIGIKRALGATPFKIVGQLVQESLFLTFVAGYGGLVLGVGVIQLVSNAMKGQEGGMFRNPEVDLNVALIALLILIIGGIIAGLIPAYRAIKITTVDALRG
ncbi:MAG: ABC transporter permease [Bacteroidia bacterium]